MVAENCCPIAAKNGFAYGLMGSSQIKIATGIAAAVTTAKKEHQETSNPA